MTAPLDLARIRHDANEAAKFVHDSRGTRVLEQDVPALIVEVERLRDEHAKAVRECDSLARRCALRYEETVKLRDRLGYRQAVVDAARELVALEKRRTDPTITGREWAPLWEAARAATIAAVDALPPDGPGNGSESAVEATGAREGGDG